MVELSKQGNNIRVEIKGFHKFWAFKRELYIPVSQIIEAYQDEEEINNFRGIRALGTSIPYVLCAGTFLFQEGTFFCDFSNRKNAIIISLRDNYYTKLVVEVNDPEEAIYFLASSARNR